MNIIHPTDRVPEQTCRICYEPGNLINVCNCSGTVKYVHFECLTKWIAVSAATKCELCGSVYREPVPPGAIPRKEWMPAFDVAARIILMILWYGIFGIVMYFLFIYQLTN